MDISWDRTCPPRRKERAALQCGSSNFLKNWRALLYPVALQDRAGPVRKISHCSSPRSPPKGFGEVPAVVLDAGRW